MRRRALLAGLFALPLAGVAKAFVPDVAGPAINRLYPHQRHAILGMMYGMGAKRISETYGISPDEAQRILGEFQRTQAGLHVWMRQIDRRMYR